MCINHEATIREEEKRSRRLEISVQKPAVERGGGRGANVLTPPPLTHHSTLCPSWSVDISFKDDVTVILFFSVIFMASTQTWPHRRIWNIKGDNFKRTLSRGLRQDKVFVEALHFLFFIYLGKVICLSLKAGIRKLKYIGCQHLMTFCPGSFCTISSVFYCYC